MVLSIVAASLVLLGASASAQSIGSAYVVNQCNYDVYLCSVPAAGGGQQETDQTLAPGQSWNQQWTELTNRNGWSIKLSKTDNLNDILQYEYTFLNDGTIWYDLSCVNGNPWDKDWEISSVSDGCVPKQQFYRYATDDAYGEQSCPQHATITVKLCSGLSADNGTAVSHGSGSGSGSSGSASAAPSSAPVSVAAPSTSAAPAPAVSTSASPSVSTSASQAAAAPQYDWNNADAAASGLGDNKQNVAPPAVTPTTFATMTTAVLANGADGEVYTEAEVETVVVTSTVVAYAPKGRRHQHEHHARSHQHHAA